MRFARHKPNVKRAIVLGLVLMLIANLLMHTTAYATEYTQADNVVVSFLELEQPILTYQYKLALERVLEDMPKKLQVIDDDGEQLSIEVENWVCIEDYDQNLGTYHFQAVINESFDETVPIITVIVEDENEGAVAEYIEVEDLIDTPEYNALDAGIMLLSDESQSGSQSDDGQASSSDNDLFYAEEELPTYYNEYEEGWLPAIRNQGSEGACWAFAAIGAVEIDLIKQKKADKTIDLSELHLSYFSTHDSDDPEDCRDGDKRSYASASYLSHGGNSVIATRTLANKIGAVREEYAPYSAGNTYVIPQEYATSVDYTQLKEVGRINVHDHDSIKKAVMEHGSVTCAYYARTGSYTKAGETGTFAVRYSSTHNSWYGTLSSTNHNVLIVGWDDNFSKENFYEGCKPEGDGAWLVRNSWGLDDYGKNGYFWLSYYDASYLAGKNVYYFISDTDVYDHVYAYDSVANKDIYYEQACGDGIRQEFAVPEGQYIDAIGFETLDAELVVDIELSCGESSVSAQEMIPYLGYHTVVLDEPVYVDESSKVTASINFTSIDGSNVHIPVEGAENYTSKNATTGGIWTITNTHEAPKTELVKGNGMASVISEDARIKLLSRNYIYSEHDAEAKVSDVSLNLSGRIGVNFYMNLPNIAKRVVIADQSGGRMEYPVSDIYRKNSKYCYTYYVSPKEVSDKLTIKILDEANKIIPITNDSASNGILEYSVDDYLSVVLDASNGYHQNDTRLYNLCQSINDYSLYSKYYLGYKASEINDEKVDTIVDDFSAYTPEINIYSDDLEYIGSSLVLDANTTIRHYFKTDGNYRYVVSNTNEQQSMLQSGAVDEQQVMSATSGVNEREVVPFANGNICYVEIDNIPAALLGNAYELKIYDENGSLVGNIDYSALSYGQRVMKRYGLEASVGVVLGAGTDSFKLVALCNSLKAYNNAAINYWDVVSVSHADSVLSLKLDKVNMTIDAGDSASIQATALPMDSVDFGVTWTSSDPSVAKITRSGTGDNFSASKCYVEALKPGKTLIKAETANGVWAQCLVTVGDGGRPVLGDNYINVTSFMGEGISPTDAFNNAIQALTDECNTLYVPAGAYQLNACNMVTLKSNINIIMDDGVKINVKANEADSYDMFYGENISNVKICGGHIAGERYSHKGSTGEWGKGIGLYSCENISIYDMKIDECWGDGIYIGSSDNITKCNNIKIVNCTLENNRRNNMSIVAGDNIVIDGCTFCNASGTDPQNGLDIEPNYLEQVCTDISLFNSHFYGNKIAGMTMANVTYSIALCEATRRVAIVGCNFEDGLWNYGGNDAYVSDSIIGDYLHYPSDPMVGDNIHWRSGIYVAGNVHINDGSAEEDELVAYYNADCGVELWHPFGTNGSNLLNRESITGADDGGIRCVRFVRPSDGYTDCGYYINLKDISLDGSSSLEYGQKYRFEYVLKGTGEWGTQTSQSDWYFCSPKPDKYRTYMTTQNINKTGDMQFSFKTNSTGAGMYIDVVELKIYKVN